nr:group II intron maturase-specific domain-containing protein [Candidatus Frankia alpina]
MRGTNVAAVIRVMNPRIRGQENYFRNGASKEAYQSLDEHLWQLIYKWLRHRHPGRSWKWIVNRYFGQFNPDRNDRWILGDRRSGAYLHKYAWTPIVRHTPVPGRNSPDDPDLAQYWVDRRRRRKPPQLAKSRLAVLRAQDGNCPLCGLPLLFDGDPPDSPSQWERWYTAAGRAMTFTVITDSEKRTKHRLVHTSCTRRHGDGTRPARTSRTGTRPPLSLPFNLHR